MSTGVRTLASRTLSPRAFHLVRYIRWQGKHVLPRKAAAVFTRTLPITTAYSAQSGFADEIHAANLLAPTHMCQVMTWHGSDKGYVRHNYTSIYSKLFASLRGKPIRIMELGLGTNNPALISSMGEMGMPGASLRGWRELFPKAQVYGADIDRDILFKSERIETYYCDQLDAEAIHSLWAQPALQGGMDILIDDGLHTFEGNVSFLNGSLQNLRPGGIYIVEDILSEEVPHWHDYLAKTASSFGPEFEFVFTELPNKFNRFDNNLLLIRRAA